MNHIFTFMGILKKDHEQVLKEITLLLKSML